MVIFVERGIGIDGAAKPFADDQLRTVGLQVWMKPGSVATLDAMVRPQGLIPLGQGDGVEWLFARMRGGKA